MRLLVFDKQGEGPGVEEWDSENSSGHNKYNGTPGNRKNGSPWNSLAKPIKACCLVLVETLSRAALARRNRGSSNRKP